MERATDVELLHQEGVYVIHFCRAFSHARHYTGYALDVARRIQEHRHCPTAKLMIAIRGAAIDFVVSHVWYGEKRTFERSLKRRHNAAAYCPICQQERKTQHDQ